MYSCQAHTYRHHVRAAKAPKGAAARTFVFVRQLNRLTKKQMARLNTAICHYTLNYKGEGTA